MGFACFIAAATIDTGADRAILGADSIVSVVRKTTAFGVGGGGMRGMSTGRVILGTTRRKIGKPERNGGVYLIREDPNT